MSSDVVGGDWVGRVIDEKFALGEWLGGTERSGVFVTEMPGADGQKATIKLVPLERTDAEERIREWQAAQTVAHPHLVRIFETGRCQVGEAQFAYVVTEYADEVLSKVLTERALTTDETREMLGPVVDALLFLHAKGFVHGHVRPSNLLAVNDELKLSADGLQAAGEMRKRRPAREIDCAPESGGGLMAPAADVWSVGVTVVEALTQRPPDWDRNATAEPVVPDSMAQPFVEIARECLRIDLAERCTLSVVKTLLEGKIKPGARAVSKVSAQPDLVAKTAARPVTPRPLRIPVAEPASVRGANTEPPRNLRVVPIVLAAIVVMAIIVALVLHSYKSELPVSTEGATPQGAVSDNGQARGAVLERVMPAVPQKAIATIHGTVPLTVRVKVNAAGEVTDATLASSGPSKYFARFALEASRGWKFRAARRGGKDVSSAWMLHYQFRADGIKVTPVEEAP